MEQGKKFTQIRKKMMSSYKTLTYLGIIMVYEGDVDRTWKELLKNDTKTLLHRVQT